jgi:hypothetical protein
MSRRVARVELNRPFVAFFSAGPVPFITKPDSRERGVRLSECFIYFNRSRGCLCHLTTISGLTMIKTSRQSFHSFDKLTRRIDLARAVGAA